MSIQIMVAVQITTLKLSQRRQQKRQERRLLLLTATVGESIYFDLGFSGQVLVPGFQ